MTDKFKIAEMKEQFANKPFTSKELYQFYLNYESDLKENTFRWRIYKENFMLWTNVWPRFNWSKYFSIKNYFQLWAMKTSSYIGFINMNHFPSAFIQTSLER